MGGGGIIGFLVVGFVLAFPFSRILPRVGLSPWFALACFVPLGALVLLYVVAFRKWNPAP